MPPTVLVKHRRPLPDATRTNSALTDPSSEALCSDPSPCPRCDPQLYAEWRAKHRAGRH